jgi:hypothetical protein
VRSRRQREPAPSRLSSVRLPRSPQSLSRLLPPPRPHECWTGWTRSLLHSTSSQIERGRVLLIELEQLPMLSRLQSRDEREMASSPTAMRRELRHAGCGEEGAPPPPAWGPPLLRPTQGSPTTMSHDGCGGLPLPCAR